ncbi:MAG: DHH family phosphoesterase [Pirellulaceae bacterium]
MDIDWNRFCNMIKSHENFVLVSHIRPDCDALGSELGMAGVLRALGKKVRIVNGQETPPNLSFIDPQNEILAINHSVKPEDLADADCILILDTSAKAQLGDMFPVIQSSSAHKAILDHHVSDDEIGAEVFKRTTAEATGTLVVEAAEKLGVTITKEIAVPLFAAIATDTGWFRFGSVTDYTYETIAKLLRAGVVPADVYGKLYERETLGRVRLRGVVLERIETELDGRLAHTYILKEDYERTGALPSDTEDLINNALAIKGTEFAVIMVGQLGGGFKISFRSRCHVACNEVAGNFGGGGHKAAAGAFIDGEFEAVRDQLLSYVRDALS